MQALVATHTDALVELRDAPEPTAAPDEAIIEVHAFSLNRGELSLLANRPEGWRPGQDISGIVVKAAQDGSGPKEGTRVVALVDGAGWSLRVNAPTTRIAEIPEEVSFAAAATPVAGLTALRTLRYGGPLLGRRVLVTERLVVSVASPYNLVPSLAHVSRPLQVVLNGVSPGCTWSE